MPSFPWSTALVASSTDNRPLANWQFRRLPYRALVTILQRATTTGVRCTISTGSTVIQQRAPVQGGGTAGTTPSALNTPAVEFIGDAGDEVVISNDEVAAGAPTVDGYIDVNPV